MELSIPERITLLNVLPQQGNVITLRILQELRMSLSFSEKELTDWKIKNTRTPDGVTITWDEDFAKETKDVKICKVAAGIIKKELIKKDQQRTLTVNELPLYERFVEVTDKTEEKA